jgi:CBS domain-containing protein
MSLIIIDQGNRIQTPVKALFKQRSVDETAASNASRSLPGSDENMKRPGERFIRLDPESNRHPAPQTGGAQAAYEETSKAGKPKTARPVLRAQQIMTFPVQTITTTASLRQAWLQLEEHNIAHLVVLDDSERPVGLISRPDILEHGTDSTVTVAVVYQKQMVAATLETELSQIASTFVNYPISAIPVISEKDELLGIISRTDLVRLLINDAQVESWA